jgi:hypothetical protein
MGAEASDDEQVPAASEAKDEHGTQHVFEQAGPAPWSTHPERVPQAAPGQHIVFLDDRSARPVSQYSPEGEIRMMGDLARGLSRSKSVSKPMAYGLVLIILLPILVSVIAVLLSWTT